MSLFHTLKFVVNHPLNRHRKAKAILDFARWQVGSRLVPGKVVYTWVNGAQVIVRPGETGLTGNIYCGLHELPDMSYVLHVLSANDLFVDVGANVGSYTILACAARGARGYCFEPVPETYQRLMDNLRLNDLLGRVNALNIGLGETDGELAFTVGENCTNHVVSEEEAKQGGQNIVRVPVKTLDAVLANESPAVMKIDVEGFETPVLKGAQRLLSSASLHSVIMELNNSANRYGFSEDAILQQMKDFGFNTYSYDPFIRELKPLHGKNNASGNTLFLRSEDKIREKLAKSEKVKIGQTVL